MCEKVPWLSKARPWFSKIRSVRERGSSHDLCRSKVRKKARVQIRSRNRKRVCERPRETQWRKGLERAGTLKKKTCRDAKPKLVDVQSCNERGKLVLFLDSNDWHWPLLDPAAHTRYLKGDLNESSFWKDSNELFLFGPRKAWVQWGLYPSDPR